MAVGTKASFSVPLEKKLPIASCDTPETKYWPKGRSVLRMKHCDIPR